MGSILYRFELELADQDRQRFGGLSLRVSQHPSEQASRMILRVLARALEDEEGLDFGPGLSDGELAALERRDDTGAPAHWIDVGAPRAVRLHRASKSWPKVSVYSDRESQALHRLWKGEKIHRAAAIPLLLVEPGWIEEAVVPQLERVNHWSLHRDGTSLALAMGERYASGSLRESSVARAQADPAA